MLIFYQKNFLGTGSNSFTFGYHSLAVKRCNFRKCANLLDSRPGICVRFHWEVKDYMVKERLADFLKHWLTLCVRCFKNLQAVHVMELTLASTSKRRLTCTYVYHSFI